MNRYELVLEDMAMYRQPQSIEERHIVEAETAADAITIGGLRYRFPLSEKLTPHENNFHQRKLIDVIALKKFQAKREANALTKIEHIGNSPKPSISGLA